MLPTIYRIEWEWGSFTIKRGKRGFVIEGHSQVQGKLTGWRVLLYYDNSYNEQTNLSDKPFNQPDLTIGHHLYDIACDWLKGWPKNTGDGTARVLRHGSVVA